jgi:signal transduction histidine kinase
MNSASAQQPERAGLSSTSCRMLDLRDAVFVEWERRVRELLAKADQLPHPILIDTLPEFYNDIAEALTRDFPRHDGVEGSSLAAEHGGERARVTTYDQEALIREYQLFRWVIYDVLHREGVTLSRTEVLVIDASIDTAIQEAVAEFALVHSTLRERFAAALTHDLRGPLGTVSSALELIQRLDDPARMKALAGRALENVRRMDGMIHELLDTMAFHSGQNIALELCEFDMREVVGEVQAATGAVGESRLVVQDGPAVRGWWDRSAMKRTVENLVSNALKYGSADTPITISTDDVLGRLRLAVHNEGAPIPPGEQERIFQMYRRSETARSAQAHGWGIGLPYVRAVAESHGGSIGLDSHPGRGTTFSIDVPLDCRPFHGSPTTG